MNDAAASAPRPDRPAFRLAGVLAVSALAFVLRPSPVQARQAILSYFRGTVEVQAPTSTFWRKAQLKMFVNEGEKIRTGKRSTATLLFRDGTRTRLGPDTTLSMTSLSAPVQLSQSGGRTRNRVNKYGRGFKLRTPTAVCSVRGTDFGVEVGENGNTNLDVFEGVVNGMKLATGESVDVGAGNSLSFDAGVTPLGEPAPLETSVDESAAKQLARKEVGLDMTREQLQAAVAEEMKLAEYQEGKSLIDVNGRRVRVEEYILRRPKDVAEAERDKAFKFVVLNTREDRLDFFTYKGIFNKTLPEDLSVALRNVSGRKFGTEPEFYLTAYEMAQSNLTDAIKDLADGGHLVKVTFDGATYNLEAHGVASDGSAGPATDTVLQNAGAEGKDYDPVADVYRNPGAGFDGVYDPDTDAFQTMSAGDTLWRTVFNRYAHMMGPSSQLAGLGLTEAEAAYRAGTLSQPYFQFYTNTSRAGAALARTGAGNTPAVTNIATLESFNNAALNGDPTFNNFTVGGRSLDLIPDQQIGDAYFAYLNGRYAFDSSFPSGADKLNIRLITYYPKSSTDIPFEQYDTFILSDEGKIAPTAAFASATSGKAFKEELIKWNYQQVTHSSAFGGTAGLDDGRTIDIVVEPKILIRSGLIK